MCSNKEDLQRNRGVVYTTAMLFRETNLIERLIKNNIRLEVVKEQFPLWTIDGLKL
ncbi:hypothetical protein MAR_002467 [Mya arenaria]|uniref:Uncharacterized protein n=1 Tax=Mya arenaria TaxID=6604 RepID=A0ABY7FGV3_MYAAR|nr:hypothetical protein MAR_002447 [Mya arenaria]WAR20629.1 hypothetical protein MAR_002467 [Mya arenaria]